MNTNPRAFPGGLADGVDPEVKVPYTGGMTLRDYFAAAALTGLAADENVAVAQASDQHMIAQWAYGLADAMLARREG